MPTYSYACTECDNKFDIVQSFSDDSLTECPRCGGRLRKLFNSVGIVFKGSGFYLTDYKDRPKEAGASSSSTSKSDASGGSNDGASAGTNAEGGTTTKTDTPKGD